jgi:PPP family 3-phenylpropionic acid transporter
VLDKQISTLRGLQFWQYAVVGVLAPFLPLYFETRGFTSSQIGVLMMAGPLLAIFFQPIWGYISDRLQTVKKVIFVLWVCAILCSIGLFLADSYVATFWFVMLMYFFLQPSLPLLDSLTIQATASRGLNFGSVRLFGSIGFTVVALTGGYILQKLGGISNISYLFWAVWVFPILLLFRLREEPAQGERMTLEAIKGVFRNKMFLLFLLLVFLISVPHRMNDVLLGLYMKELGASDAMVGWAWALAAACEIPAFALLSRYLKRIHEFVLIGLVGILYSVRWLLYALATDPWMLFALQGGAAITFAVFWIAAIHYAVRILPMQLCSTGQSLLAMVFLGLAGIVGGGVGGWLNDNYGGSSMYVFAAIVSLIAGIGFLVTEFVSRTRRISL